MSNFVPSHSFTRVGNSYKSWPPQLPLLFSSRKLHGPGLSLPLDQNQKKGFFPPFKGRCKHSFLSAPLFLSSFLWAILGLQVLGNLLHLGVLTQGVLIAGPPIAHIGAGARIWPRNSEKTMEKNRCNKYSGPCTSGST